MAIKFADGAYSTAEFAETYCKPYFESSELSEYPGAAYYAICYGELCAYSADGSLLASRSELFPDCEADNIPDCIDKPSRTGEWVVCDD